MIIVIDTSSALSALALLDQSRTPVREATSPSGRTFDLPAHFRDLVAGQKLTAVAVATGPGSFTGLRVGVSFGLGLAMTVAPLTAAVLASVDDAHVGVGSAINNAVSRLAGLLSVAVLPTVVHLQTSPAAALTRGFRQAMLIAAGLAAAGGLIAFATIRESVRVRAAIQPSVLQCCNSPELAASGKDAAA